MDPNSIITIPLNPQGVAEIVLAGLAILTAIASLIVKIVPTLSENSRWLPLIKILAKLALNTRTPTERPK